MTPRAILSTAFLLLSSPIIFAGSDRWQPSAQDIREAEEEAARHAQWQPPAEDKREVEELVNHWLSLRDQGNLEEAYKLFSSRFRASVDLESWRKNIETTSANSGPLKSRELSSMLWFHDPKNAPRGTYAALVIRSAFEKVNKQREVVLLHKRDGEKFTIMRYELTYSEPRVEEHNAR